MEARRIVEIVINSYKTQQLIPHIKLVRLMTDMGLKDTKDYVEQNINLFDETLTFRLTAEQFGMLMAKQLDKERNFNGLMAVVDRPEFTEMAEFILVKVTYMDDARSGIIDLTRK